MENILDKLYNLHIKTETYPFGLPNSEKTKEEWNIYYCLCENLSKENKELFLKYNDLQNERRNEELKYIYESGFKTAIKFVIEGLKE